MDLGACAFSAPLFFPYATGAWRFAVCLPRQCLVACCTMARAPEAAQTEIRSVLKWKKLFAARITVPVVAYIANKFPSPVEPYVQDEIRELRRRGVTVIATTARRPKFAASNSISPDINLQKIAWWSLVQSIFLLICRFPHLADLFARMLFQGKGVFVSPRPLSRPYGSYGAVLCGDTPPRFTSIPSTPITDISGRGSH